MKLTAKEREAIRNRPWNERLAELHVRWPATAPAITGGDEGRTWWFDALGHNDFAVLGQLYGDILSIGWGTPSRSGPRAVLDEDTAAARHRALEAVRLGAATTSPFAEAFVALAGERTVRALANRTGIDRTRVFRLLGAAAQPTPEEMARIAQAFNKPATYFLEYRVYLAVDTLAARLLASPEQSIELVHRLGAAS